MIDFLIMGGPIFTFPMTLIFLINIVLMARNFTYLRSGKFKKEDSAYVWVDSVKYIGIFLLAVGILGQIIGLYSAFEVIEANQIEISPALMAGGIKVSSITTLLGLAYFLISYAAWFALNLLLAKYKEAKGS